VATVHVATKLAGTKRMFGSLKELVYDPIMRGDPPFFTSVTIQPDESLESFLEAVTTEIEIAAEGSIGYLPLDWEEFLPFEG
jgi:hypothetical protein